jgi:hypothetical protein
MAFKLTKEDQTRLKTIIESMRSAYEELTTAKDMYNDTLVQFGSLRDEVVNNWQEEFEEKSENWQESEKGSAVQSMIDSWLGVDVEQLADVPDDISRELEDLPVEPDV